MVVCKTQLSRMLRHIHRVVAAWCCVRVVVSLWHSMSLLVDEIREERIIIVIVAAEVVLLSLSLVVFLLLLLLILCLERSKKGLITCKLLRCSNAIDPRTGHVAIGHWILLAWILCRPVLILVVGMRHTLHIRTLGRTLVLSHVGLRNTLRIHVRHSEVAVAYRHGWLRSLLIRHLPIGSWWMLTGNLSALGLLCGLRPLLCRHSIWNALLRAEHLGVPLLLSL